MSVARGSREAELGSSQLRGISRVYFRFRGFPSTAFQITRYESVSAVPRATSANNLRFIDTYVFLVIMSQQVGGHDTMRVCAGTPYVQCLPLPAAPE